MKGNGSGIGTPRRQTSLSVVVALIASLLPPTLTACEPASDVPRRHDGRPDLTGTYDVKTLTPLERPVEYGEQLSLSVEEARAIGQRERERRQWRALPSDPEREAPPEGGDGSPGAAGNVGGYNTFWIDRGDGALEIDGKWRTSILVDPSDGRLPPLSAEGKRRAALAAVRRHENTGTAWWLHLEVGPYDHPELRPLGERCILSQSRSRPPLLSALYNNLKRIVQTDDHVMILAEQMHDARIIRLDAEHGPPELRRWMGDSIGHWEGDTLVVDSLHFRDIPRSVRGAAPGVHVVERFTPRDDGSLLYRFTVEDPSYTAPYSGEYLWPRTDGKVFEYACHEGNYSFTGILRGARVLEVETGGGGSE